MLRRIPLFPILLTLGLVAARVLRTSALGDPLGNRLPESLHLQYPAVHLILAPLFDLWDAASLLSMSRLQGLVAGLALFFLLWRVIAGWRRRSRDPDAGPPIGLIRELGAFSLGLVGFVVFLAGGILWHRPMVSLRGVPPGAVVADFHSHTNASHDVAGGLMDRYDAEANRRWHARAGFDVAFVTDHNAVEGFPSEWANAGSTRLCPGVEVSAWRAHIVLLGARDTLDRAAYRGSLDGLLQLIRTAGQNPGILSIASLPEYDRNHWANLAALARSGIAGFEIVNASPKANEFTRARRDSVIALARRHNLLLLAVTDSHGWGATVLGWNLVSLPGWVSTSPAACDHLLSAMERGGTNAVQIVERHHLRRDSGWPWLLTPLGLVWESWRSMSPLQVLSWLVWIWLTGLVAAYRRA